MTITDRKLVTINSDTKRSSSTNYCTLKAIMFPTITITFMVYASAYLSVMTKASEDHAIAR